MGPKSRIRITLSVPRYASSLEFSEHFHSQLVGVAFATQGSHLWMLKDHDENVDRPTAETFDADNGLLLLAQPDPS